MPVLPRTVQEQIQVWAAPVLFAMVMVMVAWNLGELQFRIRALETLCIANQNDIAVLKSQGI